MRIYGSRGVRREKRGSQITAHGKSSLIRLWFALVAALLLIPSCTGSARAAEPPQASLTIDSGGTLDGSSTYNSGSFKIKNLSSSGQKLRTLRIDLGSSVLPDMLFDPKGTAGDTTAKCFTPDSGAATVGLVAPADPCASPFSEPRDGGYEVMQLSFSDFGPGEEFTFSVDVDPTSIKGFAGAGGAGSVSGLELTGAQATAGFDDGSSQSAQTFRIPQSATGSTNTLKANPLAKPAIGVVGVQAPAKVPTAQQTVRVSGPAGSSVSLMVLEGGLFTKPSGGFYDLDPYEANSAVKVSEHNATIGSGGTVDIPVTLSRSADTAGLNYMVAALKDASGSSGPLSNVVVLEYDESADTPPTVTNQRPAPGSRVRDRTPTISATVSDNTELSQDNIKLYVDGQLKAFSYDATTDKLTYVSSRLRADSRHQVKVEATDDAGNQTISTWNFRVARRQR